MVGNDDVEKRLQHALGSNPFDGDFGVPGDTTLRNKIVTARREHPCKGRDASVLCTGFIAKGERHRVMVDVADGEMQQHRWCQVCTLAIGEGS